MNFLAHDHVLPEAAPPRTRVATVLPDLWSRLARPPLALVVRRDLEGVGTAAAREVADGIRYHLAADAAFHRHPAFAARERWLTGELEGRFPGLGEARLAAHLLVELLLDRLVMGMDPGLAERWLAGFRPEVVDEVAAHGVTEPAAGAELGALLRSFAGSRFVMDYATPEGLVYRWLRALRRTHLVHDALIDARVAAEALPAWGEALAPGSEGLLADVRAAVAAAGP